MATVHGRHRGDRRLRRRRAPARRRRGRRARPGGGRVGATLAIAADANRILDAADQAYADFLAKAREVAGGELDVAEPAGAVIDEVDSLDLTGQNVTTIIWATGYSYDFGRLHVPVLDEQGRPVQRRGVTRRPGLYLLGLHRMHTFKSGLLAGAGGDAEYLAEHLARSG